MIKFRSKIAGLMAIIMIISMITTMGIGNNTVEAAEDGHGIQTFILPIIKNEKLVNEEHNGFTLQSLDNTNDNGEALTDTKIDLVYKEKNVSVYIPKTSEYIIGKEVPVIIRIAVEDGSWINIEDSSILLGQDNPIEATRILTTNSGEYVNGEWKNFQYILGFFPETYADTECEIAVKLSDSFNEDQVITDYANTKFEIAGLIPEYNRDIEYVKDSKELGISLINIGKEGKISADIKDKSGKIIFTSKTTRPNEFYERTLNLTPFWVPDTVYGTYVNLLMVNATSAGIHDFVVSIDGEKIYEGEVKLIDKTPMINSISLDSNISGGYLFEDDREFNISVYGSYLNKKDAISMSLVDEAGNEVASSTDSYYKAYYPNNNYHSDIIYKMKVLDSKKIDGDKRYSIKVNYPANENIIVKATEVSIYATGLGVARHAEVMDYEQGIVYIYGYNFKEGEEYSAKVRIDLPDHNKNYNLEYLDKNTLKLNMDESLSNEEYSVNITDSNNAHIGYIWFHGQDIDDPGSEQPTTGPYIDYAPNEPYSLTLGTIEYWMNLINTDEEISNYEINLLDNEDNIVAKTTINDIYSYKNNRYELNLEIKLDPNLDEGEYYLSVKYKEKEVPNRNNRKIIIKLLSGPHIGAIYGDRMVSPTDLNIQIQLYNIANIQQDKLNIQLVDLFDNIISSGKPTILNPDQQERWLNIDLKLNQILAEGHYYIRVIHDGKEIRTGYYYDSDLDYYMPYHIFVTKERLLTGVSQFDRLNIGNKEIYMTNLSRTVNLAEGEEFDVKIYRVKEFYSYDGYRQDFEYIGEVQSKVIRKDGYLGIEYKPEDFLDYSEGEYRIFIFNKDGSIFSSEHLQIHENTDTTIDPNDPDNWNPNFSINTGARMTNNPNVILGIDLDGSRGIGAKISNTEEGLNDAEAILFTGTKSIDWKLTDGDGLKTVYMNILDADGHKGPFVKEITLDTMAPEIKSFSVDKAEIEQGNEIIIIAGITEKSNVIAKLYKGEEEVKTMNMNYSGKTEDVYNYRVRTTINQDIDKIVVIARDDAGNTSAEKSIPIKVNVEVTRTLRVEVTNVDIGYPDYTVSVYNYEKNIYRTEKTNNEGIAEFTLPINLDYDISIYKSGYSDYSDIRLEEDYSLIFTVPVIREVTGKALVGTNPVEGATIIFTGDNQQYYAVSDSNGDYSIAVGKGDYDVRAEHPLYAFVDQVITASESVKNIVFYNKYILTGVVKDSITNQPIPNVNVYAYGNKDWQRVVTDNDGKYELYLINDNYNISTSYISGHKPYNDTISIKEEDLILGGAEKSINIEPINYDTSFSGNGNNIKTDASITQRGKSFNIVVNYTNKGISNATGIASMDLPTGLDLVAGALAKEFNELKPGESGKFVANVKVSESYIGSKIVIPAKVTVGGKEYPIGFAEVDVIDVTINAPMVSADGTFKVYGNVTSGSKVSIINKDTGELLAITKVIGNLYTAEIKDFVDGEYHIFAKAVHGANIGNSETKTVKVDLVNGIGVKDISITTSYGSKIGMNHEIGVPAFTAWVDMALRGNPIEIDVKLSKEFDGMKVEYLFADKVYDGSKKGDQWNAILSGWSGSGTKQIIMRITVGEIVYEFVVGQIIILIDPSGYVFDLETGDRIQGATATLEKWNNSTNSWEFWTTDPLQLNPQETDEEGKYGWMVEDGTYRVKIEKEGYENAIAGNDKSIIIPPPREDVNIGLKSTDDRYTIKDPKIAPAADHPWTIEFNEDVDIDSVTPDSVYIMDGNGNKLASISPRVEGKKVILDNNGLFSKDKTYTIVIKDTVMSVKGTPLAKGIIMKFTVK